MTLLFFGPLADIVGKTQFDLSGIQSTDELKGKIFEKYPELASHTFLLAVNKKVQQENVPLNADDEVALLPPYSGG
jgi:molybdopterin synthase sulfur carrier subunit